MCLRKSSTLSYSPANRALDFSDTLSFHLFSKVNDALKPSLLPFSPAGDQVPQPGRRASRPRRQEGVGGLHQERGAAGQLETHVWRGAVAVCGGEELNLHACIHMYTCICTCTCTCTCHCSSGPLCMSFSESCTNHSLHHAGEKHASIAHVYMCTCMSV